MGTPRSLTAAVAALAWACASAAPAAEIAMGKPAEYPHAGIALAVPENYQQQVPGSVSEVMRATLVEKDTPVQTVAVTAFTVGPEDTADKVDERIVAELRQSLAFRHLKELTKTPMPLGGLPGRARLLGYEFRGRSFVASVVSVVRDIESPKLRVAYVLNVEVAASQQHLLTQILNQVAKSVRLIDLRPASQLPMGEPVEPVTDFRNGFSLQVPSHWFVSSIPGGLVTGLGDYVVGQPIPAAQVLVQEAPGALSSPDVAHRICDADREYSEKNNLKLKIQIVSEGPVKVAGQEGYQVLMQQNVEGQEEHVTVVLRTLCLPAADQTRCITLKLIAHGKDPKAAEAMMDKLAGTFKVLSVTTVPATSAATTTSAPSSSPATAPTSQPEAPATAPATLPEVPATASAPATTETEVPVNVTPPPYGPEMKP